MSQCGTKPIQASVRQFTGLQENLCAERPTWRPGMLCSSSKGWTQQGWYLPAEQLHPPVCVFLGASQVCELNICESEAFDSCVNDPCSDGCFGYVTTLWSLAFWGHFCFSGTEMSGHGVLTKSSPSLCSLPLYVASSSNSEAFILKKVFKSLQPGAASLLCPTGQSQPCLRALCCFGVCVRMQEYGKTVNWFKAFWGFAFFYCDSE